MTRTVLFRCGGAGTLGHLSRCIALAEAMHELGWHPVFRSALDEVGRTLLAAAGFTELPWQDSSPSEDADRTVAAAAATAAEWIVLDGYEFTPAFADRLPASGARVTVIDDYATWDRYPVDIILNFTVAARSCRYPAGAARQLLGPGYFLARRGLRQRHAASRPERALSRLCIALRGDADGGKTAAVLRTLEGLDLHVRALIPAATPHHRSIETTILRLGRESRLNLIPHDMSEDLSWADIVLCTGGMTKYEAIFLGAIPLVISNNAGEAGDTAAWDALGVGVDLGLMSDFDSNHAVEEISRLMRVDAADTLRTAARRGQALFGDDPTLAAARAILAGQEAQ